MQRRFLNSPGEVLNRGGEIVVRLDRRTYNPVLRQADPPVTAVPWWGADPQVRVRVTGVDLSGTENWG